jgi:hypothetical protein
MTLGLHDEVLNKIDVTPKCCDAFKYIAGEELKRFTSHNNFTAMESRATRKVLIDKFVELVGSFV